MDAGADNISIEIEISSYDNPSTLRITVTDNGSGFTDENFDRFKTLLKPRDDFHKGLGRLLFLEYFAQVEIDSYWENKQRNFIFSNNFKGTAPPQDQLDEAKQGSTLVFKNFLGERVHSYDALKPVSLKSGIVEHFLPILLEFKRPRNKFSNFNKFRS